MKLYVILSFILVSAFVGLGYYFGAKQVTTKIVYVDKYTPPVSKYEIPNTKTIYLPLPINRTRVDTLRVPIYITRYVIVDLDSAITITNTSVQFRYFNPYTNAYGVNTYSLKPYLYSLTTSGELSYFPVTQSIAFNASQVFNVKNMTFGAGVITDFSNVYPYLSIKYNLINKKW